MSMLEETIVTTFYWVVCLLVFRHIVKFCYHTLRLLVMTEKFKGPPSSSWLFGNFDYMTQPTDKLLSDVEEDSIKYYPHFRLRILNYVAVILTSPEDCEIVLGSKKHSTKSDIYFLLRTWLREGLLVSKGEKWVQRRRILTPAFHFSILKNFLAVFNEQTEKLVQTISQNWENPIDVVPLANEFTIHTILETAMGHRLSTDDPDQAQYRNSIYEIEKIFELRLFRPWLWYTIPYFFTRTRLRELKLLKKLHDFTKSIISKRMKNFVPLTEIKNLSKREEDDTDNMYMSKTKKRLAMLDVLLQAKVDGEQIDYEGICEEVDTFVFEGHDTTGAAIGFCLMLLANNPKIQEAAYQEIKEVVGVKTQIRYNDLKKLDLLERCIKETLRLYPSVFFISRVTEEDTVLHSGLVLPKHCMISVVISAIHKHPNIYPNPKVFDPDRFTVENSKDRHPFAYIPFSAGPRNCIGQKFAMMELKTVVAGILQNFRLIAIDTPDTIQIKPEMLLRVKNGIKVKFNPR